jgi:hypothetical protein
MDQLDEQECKFDFSSVLLEFTETDVKWNFTHAKKAVQGLASAIPTPVKDEEKRIFDRVFGRIPSFSKTAVIRMINSLYGMKLPLNSRVEYLECKTVEADLSERIADMLIKVYMLGENGFQHRFHIECEKWKNAKMGIRMHVYGYEHAVLTDDTITMPAPLVVYLDQNSTITNSLAVRMNVEQTASLSYPVKVVKFLDFTLRDLVDNDLMPLAPLHALKYRNEVNKLSQSNKLRSQAKELKNKLFFDIIDAIRESCRKGKLDWDQDGMYLAHHVLIMYRHLYGSYKALELGEKEMSDKFEYWWEPMKSELEAAKQELGETNKKLVVATKTAEDANKAAEDANKAAVYANKAAVYANKAAEDATKKAEEAAKTASLTQNALTMILDFLRSRANDADKAILQAFSIF